MGQYVMIKHYRGAPAGTIDVPLSEWSTEEFEAHVAFMRAFADRLAASGELVDQHALAPDGMWVKFDVEGKPPAVNEAFADSKDLVAGWMTIDVDSPERALALASELSSAPGPGGQPIGEWLELRPVLADADVTPD